MDEIITTQQQYRYQPLQPERQEVRIFTLQPGIGDEPVRGSLEIIGLEELCADCERDGKPWFALSYVWGSKIQGEFIEVDGERLPVTKTLKEILPQLRRPDMILHCWIDQVCIDQENIEERNTQVLLMPEIYTNAGWVEAWLGHGPATLCRALEVATSVDDYCLDASLDVFEVIQNDLSELAHRDKVALLQRFGFAQDDETSYKEWILSLLECAAASPWFERLWTLQEAVLPSTLFLRAGQARADWRAFRVLFEFVGDIRLKLKDTRVKVFSLDTMRLMVQSGDGNEARRVLESFAFTELFRKAEDERDYVYGQLGFFGAGMRRAVRPDYSLSIEDVFIQGTLAMLRSEKTLAALYSCCYKSNLKGRSLPSWCLDWSHTKSRCGVGVDIWGNKEALYNAMPATEISMDYRSTESCLILRGFLIDEVSKRSVMRSSIEKMANDAVLGSLNEYFGLSDREHNNVSLDQMLCRTFISGQSYRDSQLRASPDEISYVYKWLQSVRSGSDPNTNIGSRMNGDIRMNEKLNDALKLVQRNKRCLFRTKEHRFGRSCGAIQPGDKICLFYGASLPFLLREVRHKHSQSDSRTRGDETKYQIVGGASYIDGLVDGETLKIAEEHNLVPQDFCII